MSSKCHWIPFDYHLTWYFILLLFCTLYNFLFLLIFEIRSFLQNLIGLWSDNLWSSEVFRWPFTYGTWTWLTQIFPILFLGILTIRYYGESGIPSFNVEIQLVTWILNTEFRCECFLQWYVDVVEFVGRGKLRQSPTVEYVTLRSGEKMTDNSFPDDHNDDLSFLV